MDNTEELKGKIKEIDEALQYAENHAVCSVSEKEFSEAFIESIKKSGQTVPYSAETMAFVIEPCYKAMKSYSLLRAGVDWKQMIPVFSMAVCEGLVYWWKLELKKGQS